MNKGGPVVLPMASFIRYDSVLIGIFPVVMPEFAPILGTVETILCRPQRVRAQSWHLGDCVVPLILGKTGVVVEIAVLPGGPK